MDRRKEALKSDEDFRASQEREGNKEARQMRKESKKGCLRAMQCGWKRGIYENVTSRRGLNLRTKGGIMEHKRSVAKTRLECYGKGERKGRNGRKKALISALSFRS